MRTKPRLKTIIVIATVLFMFASTALAYSTFQPKYPSEMNKSVRYGKAAWYSENDPGVNRYTANNEIFNDEAMTCAIWDVPFNQQIRITNLANGKSVVVRVNDRGPHKRLVRKGRVIDLTKNAFMQIASLKKGLIKIRMELL